MQMENFLCALSFGRQYDIWLLGRGDKLNRIYFSSHRPNVMTFLAFRYQNTCVLLMRFQKFDTWRNLA